MSKKHKLNKKQLQEIQDGVEIEGVDYYFLEYGDFGHIKDKGFHIRLDEWKQARSELLKNYLDPEVE
jgi:hypothetical protein